MLCCSVAWFVTTPAQVRQTYMKRSGDLRCGYKNTDNREMMVPVSVNTENIDSQPEARVSPFTQLLLET